MVNFCLTRYPQQFELLKFSFEKAFILSSSFTRRNVEGQTCLNIFYITISAKKKISFYKCLKLTDLFYRHLAQVFLVKTVQSAFRITVKINITVIVFPVTQEDTAKQVSLGSLQKISNGKIKKRLRRNPPGLRVVVGQNYVPKLFTPYCKLLCYCFKYLIKRNLF